MLVALPAASDAAEPWLAGVARELREQPIYVSDSVPRAASPSELARLRATIRLMAFPVRVAILSGPPRNGSVEGLHEFELPGLLAGAVDRPGLYVVATADSAYAPGAIFVGAVGVRTRLSSDDVERAVRDDVVSEVPLIARIRYALRAAATGARPQRGDAERALDEKLRAQKRRDDNTVEDTVAIGSGVGGLLVGFSVPAVRWWRRRRAARRLRPGRLGATVREPGADIAKRASDAVADLAAAIAAAAAPSDAAFELYSAATKAAREAQTAVDHVGALLLALDGEDAVAGRAPPRRCFFDPDHPGPTAGTRWRLGREESEVPACSRCVRALGDGRMPDTLGDRGRPYFEGDTVWARTGFGAIDDELPAKVLSGR